MIYKVNLHRTEAAFFDEATNVNARQEAETILATERIKALLEEETRFSINAAVYINGNTAWRAIQDSDTEDTICQVFNTFTGQYTECANKTEAYALNEQIKEQFLSSIGLDKVYELEAMPVTNGYSVHVYGESVGTIPVEVM